MAEVSETPATVVVAGVLQSAANEYLVAQRPEGKHLAGLWEFPGGKREANETLVQALARELQEEIGIRLLAAQPLITVRHQYADRIIELHVMAVLRWQGEPANCENQSLQWVNYQQLCQLPMPAADVPILKALRLPTHYFISPSWDFNSRQWQADCYQAAQQGAGILQFRQPLTEQPYAYRHLPEVAEYAHQFGMGVIVNAPVDFVLPEYCDGLHLNSAQLMNASGTDGLRESLGSECIIGASCHTLDELERALAIDCDYALLSPVKPTTSGANKKPMGWQQFSVLTEAVNLPVYALGGLDPGDIDQARANGAIGVAGISGFSVR